MRVYLFLGLLVVAVVTAFVRGGRSEKYVACVCVFAVLATRLVIRPLSARYGDLEAGVALVDALTLCALLPVAIKSKRFWPLWVCALQLTTLIGHLFIIAERVLPAKVYAASVVFWGYPFLLILLIGAWRTPKKGKP